MHVLIILNLLIFALIGLWVLRRMWAISAAERRERRLERREQKALREQQEYDRLQARARMLDSQPHLVRAPSRYQLAGKLMLALAMWGGAMGVLIFAHP